MRQTQTVTETLTVTNTHLAVAVGLTLAIGAFALAGVPAKKVAPLKCGVSNQKTVQVLRCRGGQYSGMDYTCYDGTKQQYRPGKCVSSGVIQAYTKTVACKNRCNVPPVTKKDASPVQPVPVAPVDTGYGYGYNPVPPGYGYGYNGIVNNGVVLADLRVQDVSFNNNARTITVIVQNSGNGASGAIGRIGTNSASEGLVIHPQNQEGRNINSDGADLPALQPGATTAISFPYPPHDLMRSLQVRLDNRDIVVESNEENNITVYPMPNPLQPDLSIQDVSFNNNARTITVIVQNSGNGVSDAIGRIDPNSVSEGLVIHPQNQEGRNINSDSADLPALRPGATTSLSFPYPPHDLMRSLQVRLDNRNVLVESNEENNITVYPMPNPIQ